MDTIKKTHTKIKINDDLVGILSLPVTNKKCTAILLLHGFASDKNEVNNLYETLSNSLYEINVATLRIDFRCWGESNGDPENSTIDKMIEDAIASINYLKKLDSISTDRIAIIGFSLGAAIALLASNHEKIASLILISPALNLLCDFNKFLGKEIMSRLKNATTPYEITLPWKKIKLSNDFYLSLNKFNPASSVKTFEGNLLCIAGKSDFTCNNASRIYNETISCQKSLILVENADHIFNRPDGKNMSDEICNKIILHISQLYKKFKIKNENY